MAEPINIQDMIDGRLDIKSLGEAANGDENTQVITRLGETYPSAKRAINIMFKNGGLPATPFETKAKMQIDGSSLPDGSYAMVTDEEGASAGNNGFYIKIAGEWVKSTYDPVGKSQEYAGKAIEQSLGKYFEKNINLYNPAAAEVGYAINANGVKTATTDYSISEFILIEPNTVYTMARTAHSQSVAFVNISFYDSNKTFLVRNVYPAMPTGYQQITTPPTANYVVLNMNAGLPNEGNRMFYRGTAQLPYTPYTLPKLKGVELSAAITDKLADSFMSADYVSKAYNLFDAQKATKGVTLLVTGVLESNPSYAVSDFIPIVHNSAYTMYSTVSMAAYPFAHIAYYDANKQFIERVGISGTKLNNYITITTPNNPSIKYARLNINAGAPEENNRMIYRGSVVKPYIPFGAPKLINLELGDTALKQVNANQKFNNYLLDSKNLFNPDTATKGKAILATGVISDNADYSISNFIAVKPLSQYTISGVPSENKNTFIHTSYYDADKVFLQRINSFNVGTVDGRLVITTPANAAFVRLNMNAGTPYDLKRMFLEGDTTAAYQPYGQTFLTGVKLADDVITGLNIPSGGGGTTTASEGYYYSRPMDLVFNIDKVWTQYTDWNNVKAATVYQMFDALMAAYPDYITKKALGNDPVDNSPIAAYYFTPARQPSPVATKRPKVFSVCGIHGMEHVSPLTHYLMLKGMCEDWKTDPMLEALRFNVDWIIIPISNPWGFDRFTRKNGNGIDLNRNFPADWEYVDPTVDSGHYAGEVAGSELETQYMMRIINENPDLDIVYDCHSFNGDINHHHITWLHLTGKNANDAKQHQLFQALGRRLDAKWRKDFAWFPPTTTYPLTRNTQGTTGQVQNYANLKGVPYPACFEVGARWWDKPGSTPFTDYHVKSVVEVTVNWYLMLLNYLGK